MVSNLQHYPYVAITNKTPYTLREGVVDYNALLCSTDWVKDLSPGQNGLHRREVRVW